MRAFEDDPYRVRKGVPLHPRTLGLRPPRQECDSMTNIGNLGDRYNEGLFFIMVAVRNSKIALRFALARSCAHTVVNTFPH